MFRTKGVIAAVGLVFGLLAAPSALAGYSFTLKPMTVTVLSSDGKPVPDYAFTESLWVESYHLIPIFYDQVWEGKTLLKNKDGKPTETLIWRTNNSGVASLSGAHRAWVWIDRWNPTFHVVGSYGTKCDFYARGSRAISGLKTAYTCTLDVTLDDYLARTRGSSNAARASVPDAAPTAEKIDEGRSAKAGVCTESACPLVLPSTSAKNGVIGL